MLDLVSTFPLTPNGATVEQHLTRGRVESSLEPRRKRVLGNILVMFRVGMWLVVQVCLISVEHVQLYLLHQISIRTIADKAPTASR